MLSRTTRVFGVREVSLLWAAQGGSVIFSPQTLLLIQGLSVAFETPEPDSKNPEDWSKEIERIETKQNDTLILTLRYFRQLESEREARNADQDR